MNSAHTDINNGTERSLRAGAISGPIDLSAESVHVKQPRVDPFVRQILQTQIYRSWSDFILNLEESGSTLSPGVRRLYRAVGSAFMGFVLRQAVATETQPAASPLEVEQALASALKSCDASRVRDFLLERGQGGSQKKLEATSVLRNHFRRWALQHNLMSYEAFPELVEERYDALVARSRLLQAFVASVGAAGDRCPESLSSESRDNLCRVTARFLRWVAKENLPPLARAEIEPDYDVLAGQLDDLVTQKLDLLLRTYCGLKSEGGVFDSRQSVNSARSVLYKYFLKVVPGGASVVKPCLRPKGQRKLRHKSTEPDINGRETKSDQALPAPKVPRTEPIEVHASNCESEIREQYDRLLENALAQLSLALKVPRHELGRLRLNDVREINYSLRVFTHNLPSSMRRGGNYLDLDSCEAFQAVRKYLVLNRQRPSRKAFFFETFDAQPLPDGKGKRR